MMFILLRLVAFLWAFIAVSAKTTSTYVEPTVPTGKPVVGDYSGPLRPQIHFSPPKGFMNDPNGMFVDASGLYHLYYQYNPNDTIAGNQHWGHATSRDLYHWKNQPIAIFPSNSSEGVFSGSAVIDDQNTSGFFPNQTDGVVAIYTINTPYQQSQAIAFSYDNGYTFEKYAGNPVLTAASANFRDPKVIYHAPTSKWIMAVAYAQEFTVGLFTSPNLINWTHASNFSREGLLGNQWECPNLIEIPVEGANETMYLLLISINPGAPLGGSISQYFPGNFNGTHFSPVNGVARMADFGKDNYAGQFFYGIPANQSQVSIAWASNWQYTNYVPTGPLEGWQSAMSVPRLNHLKKGERVGWELVSQPHDLTPVLPISPLAVNKSVGNGTLVVDFGGEGRSGSVYLELKITGLNRTNLSNTASANFTFFSSISGESLSGGQFLVDDAPFFLDRSKTNGLGVSNPLFTGQASTAPIFESEWSCQVIVDRSVWEVFLMGGERSATLTFFPEFPLDTVVVKTGEVSEGAVVSVAVWELESAWVTAGNSTAYVSGNSTMRARRAV